MCRPVEVRTHDFKDKDLGHAIPYGVYDLKANDGMMSVGVTNDASQFASQLDPRVVDAPRACALPQRELPDDHR